MVVNRPKYTATEPITFTNTVSLLSFYINNEAFGDTDFKMSSSMN